MSTWRIGELVRHDSREEVVACQLSFGFVLSESAVDDQNRKVYGLVSDWKADPVGVTMLFAEKQT